MARFADLEAEQQPKGTTRCDADGAYPTPRPWYAEKGRRLSTLVTPEPVTTSQETQEEADEVIPDSLYVEEEPIMATNLSGFLGS